MPVSRFAVLAGIPERTYRFRLARFRDQPPLVKGPWPGGLLLPQGFRADHRTMARLRRQVFLEPVTHRNQVWQMDFSEFETTGGGIWRLCAVIDYATKYCLAITVTPTSKARDAVACVKAAVAEAEQLLDLDDLREDRANIELLEEDTGELIAIVPAPIALVSDNGPAFRAATFKTLFAGKDPLLKHVRTRVRSPQTNGVIERFFGTAKYEYLFRAIIGDGDVLSQECNRFRTIYNTMRPHHTIGYKTPVLAYLQGQTLQDS